MTEDATPYFNHSYELEVWKYKLRMFKKHFGHLLKNRREVSFDFYNIISDHAQLVTYNVINIEQNDLTGHAVEPSEEEEDSTTNEVFYPGYPGIIIRLLYILF